MTDERDEAADRIAEGEADEAQERQRQAELRRRKERASRLSGAEAKIPTNQEAK